MSEFSVVPNSPIALNTGINFEQRIGVTNEFGTVLRDQALFPTDAASTNATLFALEPGVPLAGVGAATVTWSFTDAGVILTPALGDTPQGEAYRATLSHPALELAGIPLAYSETEGTARSGPTLADEKTFSIVVPPELLTADLRLRLADQFNFASAVAPDGQVLSGFTTRGGAGPAGFDRTKVLQEHYEGFSQITVPWEIVQSHGPGNWTLRASSTAVQEVQPGLAAIAILLHLVPVPLAFLALRDTRAFERVAFGGYRRTARRLFLVTIAVGLYYVAFLLAALVAGRLGQMTILPLSTEGLFLYLHIGLALFAFTAIWLTARELYRMTVPKEPRA